MRDAEKESDEEYFHRYLNMKIAVSEGEARKRSITGIHKAYHE